MRASFSLGSIVSHGRKITTRTLVPVYFVVAMSTFGLLISQGGAIKPSLVYAQETPPPTESSGGSGGSPCSGTTPAYLGYSTQDLVGATYADSNNPTTSFYGSGNFYVQNNDTAIEPNGTNEQFIYFSLPATIPSNLDTARLLIPVKLVNGFTVDPSATVVATLYKLTTGYSVDSLNWNNRPTSQTVGQSYSILGSQLHQTIARDLIYDVRSDLYSYQAGEPNYGYVLKVTASLPNGDGTPVSLQISPSSGSALSYLVYQIVAEPYPNPTPSWTPTATPFSPDPTPSDGFTATPDPGPSSEPVSSPTPTPTPTELPGEESSPPLE